MDLNELASMLIREAFHSFELEDEFTVDMLADIAFCSKLHDGITIQQVKKKASGFVQSQVKMGIIEKMNGVKMGRYQVYKKVGQLLAYKTRVIDPIPPEYEDFVSIWNDMNVGDTVTASDFYQTLKKNEIEITYEGQSSKFLWIISDRGLAQCQQNNQDPKKNVYIRIDSIPESLLRMTATKFMKIPCGEYQSCLNQLL